MSVRVHRKTSTAVAAVLTILAVMVSAAPPAAAQAPAPAPTPAPPPVTVGWNDGFFIQSPDAANRLLIGFVLQTDGRFSLDEPSPFSDTFVLRKVRPVFNGRVARFVEFRVMPELAGGSATLLDGYVDLRFTPAFRIRGGKEKTPVGYELLIGDASLLFPERSVVSLLVPNRDIGFSAQGEAAGGKIIYAGGIYNGSPLDGGSTAADIDTNSGKDLAGRVVVLPFRRGGSSPSALNNVGFHLGGSIGDQSGALPSLRTTGGQTYFAYAAATADGRRTRVTPAAFAYVGPFGGFFEYARSTSELVRAGNPLTATNDAWGVTASYVLTGESTSDRGVRPRAPFEPGAGQWGAVQLAARYAEISIDDEIFGRGFATAESSRKATQFTLGVNWYLNNIIKIYGTYERFTFDGPRDRANENAIIVRSQLAF